MAKRVFDVVVSVAVLVLLTPMLLVAAVAIRVLMGAPVLFRQVRPGLDGQPFVLLKLRTMRESPSTEKDQTDAQRLTSLGTALRRLSIDEIPQLWNVIRGDMSLVGPRPLLLEYLSLYNAEQARRHSVRPGITGWAQVNGRNAISWSDKFALDLWYVDNQSLRLDTKIILMTIAKVLRRDGISQQGHVTSERFLGN